MKISDTKTEKGYLGNDPRRGRTTKLVDKRTGTILFEVLGIGTRYELWDTYCFHMNPANKSPLWTARDLELAEQERAEQEAENAWLHHAERTTLDDMGFDRWEQDHSY